MQFLGENGMKENQIFNPEILVGLTNDNQLDSNLMLAAISPPEVSKIEELATTAINVASVDYYEFFHKDLETYRYQPLDFINGQGFW